MKDNLKKLRDICRSYHSCYDGCPLDVDKVDCVMVKPPYIWSDEDIEKFTQLVEGERKIRVSAVEKIFDKYEILTASFEDSDSPEVRSKKIDEFCIDTMRGIIGEHYADKVIQELKGGKE